jgi:hypothetical protein
MAKTEATKKLVLDQNYYWQRYYADMNKAKHALVRMMEADHRSYLTWRVAYENIELLGDEIRRCLETREAFHVAP